MDALAPGAEMLREPAGVGRGQPDRDGHLARVELHDAAGGRRRGRAAVKRCRMKAAPAQLRLMTASRQRHALEDFEPDAYRRHEIGTARSRFLGHRQPRGQDARRRMRKPGVVEIQQMR